MMEEFWRWVLDNGTWTFFWLIVVFFLSSLAELIFKWFKINKELKEAINSTKSYRGNCGGGFLSLDKDISQSKSLSFAWNEFAKQVTDGREYGFVAGLYSKSDPREFFHEESVWLNRCFYAGSSRRLIGKAIGWIPAFLEAMQPSVPSLLTGIGILGTFLGLAAGISLAAPNLSDFTTQTSSIDTDAFSKAFQPLLDGAGQAFLTSIYGLVGSILFTIFSKGCLNSCLRNIDLFCSELNQLFKVLTKEEINLRMHKVLVDQKDLATEQAEKWNTKLDQAVEQLLNAFTGFSGAQLGKLQDVMSDMFGSFSKELVTQMQGMTDSFKETAVEISKTVDALDTTLSKMTGIVDEVSEKVEKRFSEFDQHAGQVAQNMKGTAEVLDGAFKEVKSAIVTVGEKMHQVADDAAGMITKSGEGFYSAVSKGSTDFSGSVNAGVEKMNASFSQQAEALTKATEVCKQLVDLEKSITNLNEDIRLSGDSIIRASDAVGQVRAVIETAMEETKKFVQENNKENAEAIAQSLANVKLQISEITETQGKITEMSVKLKDTLLDCTKNLAESLKNGSDSFKKNVANLDTEISKAITTMSVGNTQWRDSQRKDLQNLTQISERLVQATKNLGAEQKSK